MKEDTDNMVEEIVVNSNKTGIFIGVNRRCRRFCHGRYPMDNGHVYLLSAFQVEENSRSYDCPVLSWQHLHRLFFTFV